MTKVIYPTLRLSANGSRAWLDQGHQGFQIYALPALDVCIDAPAQSEFDQMIWSASGTAVAVQTLDNTLVLLSAADHPQCPLYYPLPVDPSLIRALAIADAGDLLATLTIDPSASADQPNGVLAVWALSAGIGDYGPNQPLAMVRLPLLDANALTANGAFTTFALCSHNIFGGQRVMGVYSHDSLDGVLKPLWTEHGKEPGEMKSVAVTPYGDWVWAVQADAIVGWYQHHLPVKLAGTRREHLIYGPTGRHLLVYRGDETINVTGQKMLFRLVDLASCQEIQRAIHVIPHYHEAHFALTDSLSLLELRATRQGKLVSRSLAWSEG